ncbi:terpenoid synthase [Amylocystis lapponica]|nr:terpenoid synthase [Amylocystis lapponica]
MSDSPATPKQFVMPDLIAACPFPCTVQPNGDAIADQSDRWLDASCPDLGEKERAKLYGIRAGILAAYCYPYCDDERFRVIADYINYLFHLDDLSDEVKDAALLASTVLNACWVPQYYKPTRGQPDKEPAVGRIARDWWQRMSTTSKPGPQERFKESFQAFFEAVELEARHRAGEDTVPDVESYIEMRRDTSGCKCSFNLIEYALDIDLPDFVLEHPVMKLLHQSANDVISWSNDVYSFNVEQTRGEYFNLVVNFMQHQNLSLQEALDLIGKLYKENIDVFIENAAQLPSWGPEIDRDVDRYVQGLRDWIIGCLHWSFDSKRYFGDRGTEIKKTLVVDLLPKRKPHKEPAPAPLLKMSAYPYVVTAMGLLGCLIYSIGL